MLFSSVILALAATVSAVDIRFYSNNQGACYSGPWIGCPNANPNFCCTATGYSMSGSFYWFGDGRKRSVDQKCEGTEKATQLGLEDGSVHDISDLSDDDVEEM
ncbi:hypothetical protein ACHAPQ_004162 [Fusarium lateritium]